MTRVLVCDDSAFVCKTLAAYLEHETDLCVAGCAHNPQDAAAQAAALRPDVATIDLEMPGGSGLETLRLLDCLHTAEPVGYATSADVSGDKSRVVGYAGMLFG